MNSSRRAPLAPPEPAETKRASPVRTTPGRIFATSRESVRRSRSPCGRAASQRADSGSLSPTSTIAASGAKKPTRKRGRQPRRSSMKPARYPPRTMPTRKPEYMTETYFPLPFRGEYSLVRVMAQGTAPPMPIPVKTRMAMRLSSEWEK